VLEEVMRTVVEEISSGQTAMMSASLAATS